MPLIPDFIAPTRHTDPADALAQVQRIYQQQIGHLREAMQRFVAGETPEGPVRAFYPFVRVHTTTVARADTKLAYGFVEGPGRYETTLTRPDLFAHYYAEQAKKLGRISGAEFVPAGLTVVTPPWNFPVAIPAGSTLAALAAGSPVIIKPAAQARRCGAVMVEALWEAGVPRDALQLVNMGDRALGSKLVSDPRVDRVILTGGYETAELFRSLRQVVDDEEVLIRLE